MMKEEFPEGACYNMSRKYNRRSIRLRNYDYSKPGAYFITICTYNRKNIFGKIYNGKMHLNQFGSIVKKEWNRLPNHYNEIELGNYVIMPNHFHGIIIINNAVGAIHESPEKGNGAIHELPLRVKRRKMMLPKIIGRFKMQSAKQINAIRNTPGVPVWQRNYYEHIIRDEKDYLKIVEYIENNPIKWELDKYYGGEYV